MSNDIRVVELFAGVGGFRIGLERASDRFKTVWSNQWEPSTKRQDASVIYRKRFGDEGHCNEDINNVPTSQIPDCDVLVAGFPCQNFSVAASSKSAKGIEGEKGVLWWQIYRIISEKENRPKILLLENVDRLLISPAKQRGRDFAIIVASLNDLGYIVEWKIINAADYGMPQRRKRVYIAAYLGAHLLYKDVKCKSSILNTVISHAFPGSMDTKTGIQRFTIEGDLPYISQNFNKQKEEYRFLTRGIAHNRRVLALKDAAIYDGPSATLGDILVDESEVPEEYFIPEEELEKWKYTKGGKKFKRVNKETGCEYTYSEGAMAFPDALDKPSRTIITGEGGKAPSRFKHVIKTPSGRYRRLIPVELERLNMFPDNHTEGVSDTKRAFLMGNALVCGIVERIGTEIEKIL